MQAIKLIKIFACAVALLPAVFVCSCGKQSPEEIRRANVRKSELAVRRAQVMIAENRLDDAVVMLENAYNECGANSLVCETLANVFAQKGQTASAGMFYELAFDADNSRTEMLVFAANAYESTNSADAAANAYEKYLAKKPEDADILKKLSAVCEKQKQYAKALEALQKSLKVAKRPPDTAEAAIIGRLYVKMGDFSNAKLWLEAALKVTLPENTSTRREIGVNLLQVYIAQNDADKTQSIIEMLDAIDPKLVNTQFPTLKANIAERKHQMAEQKAKAEAQKAREEAEAAQREIIEQNEKAAKALAEKNAEELRKKEAEEAAKAEAQKQAAAKQTDTAKAEAAENKAPAKPAETESEIVSDIATDIPEPAAPQDQSAAVAPQNAAQSASAAKPLSDFDAIISRVKSAQKSGDKAAMLAEANRAVSERPESPQAWTFMAKAYELNGRLDSAELAATEAYLISNAPKEALCLLEILQKGANLENFREKALSFFGKYQTADFAYFAALAHESAGEKDEALSCFKRFLEEGDAKNAERVRRAEKFLQSK